MAAKNQFREIIKGIKLKKRDTQRIMKTYANSLKSRIIARSPVDTGFFKKMWISKIEKSKGNVVYSCEIRNNVSYGKYLEHGSEIGQEPWPRVGPRTVEYENKIYSSQAPGGVIKPLIKEEEINNLAKQIADTIGV